MEDLLNQEETEFFSQFKSYKKLEDYEGTDHKVHVIETHDVENGKGKFALHIPLSKSKEHVYTETFFNQHIVSKLGITSEIWLQDHKTGRFITTYLPGEPVTKEQLQDQSLLIQSVELLKKLHSIKSRFLFEYDILSWTKKRIYFDEVESSEELKKLKELPHIFKEMEESIAIIQKIKIPEAPVHGDATLGNFIFYKNETKLIDWQLSGMGDPHDDVATFLSSSELEPQDLVMAARYYCGDNLKAYQRLLVFIPLAKYYFLNRSIKRYVRETKKPSFKSIKKNYEEVLRLMKMEHYVQLKHELAEKYLKPAK